MQNRQKSAQLICSVPGGCAGKRNPTGHRESQDETACACSTPDAGQDRD